MEHHVPIPAERPDVEVLVDGTWCPGEVRMQDPDAVVRPDETDYGAAVADLWMTADVPGRPGARWSTWTSTTCATSTSPTY